MTIPQHYNVKELVALLAWSRQRVYKHFKGHPSSRPYFRCARKNIASSGFAGTRGAPLIGSVLWPGDTGFGMFGMFRVGIFRVGRPW